MVEVMLLIIWRMVCDSPPLVLPINQQSASVFWYGRDFETRRPHELYFMLAESVHDEMYSNPKSSIVVNGAKMVMYTTDR